MQWSFKHYDALTRDELHDILALRCRVFIVEQNCAYLDVDGQDRTAWHVFGRDAQGKLCACLRALPPQDGKPVHFGRIVLDPSLRGKGTGREMVGAALGFVRNELGETCVDISAQAHLQGFYGVHGFKTVSEPYDDAGILHVDMIWQADR